MNILAFESAYTKMFFLFFIYHLFSNNSPNEFQCTSNLFGIKYTVGIDIDLFPRAEVAAPFFTTTSLKLRGCKCIWICMCVPSQSSWCPCIHVCSFRSHPDVHAYMCVPSAVILMSMHTCGVCAFVCVCVCVCVFNHLGSHLFSLSQHLDQACIP